MHQTLTLGYSPCPNDTYIFFGLAEGRIPVEPNKYDIFIADVEALNRKAEQKALDATKISISAFTRLMDDYWMLRAGGAMGRGCGPLVVARNQLSMEDLRDSRIAIPGERTTANLLLRLHGEHRGPRVEMLFDQIMPAIARGDVDAGVIIHEGRFTYPAMGLKEVIDLGAWWEKETGLPLPLGGIVMKRSLGAEAAQRIEKQIRESLAWSRRQPEDAWPYIKSHAQEMEDSVVARHIETFVNHFSEDVGEEGEKAVRTLLEMALRLEGKNLPEAPLFRDDV
ncbi:MAG: 1,4-dihydroxy-6-naphthoate synthase [Syntrophobacteraceae bacterium]